MELAATPDDLMREYATRTNTHDFDAVAPLIADDAVYFFSDGTHTGREELRRAFEDTFAAIRDETYRIEDLRWLARDERIAVCVYRFRWRGLVGGREREESGRGTSVLAHLDGRWQVVHEHLSPMPV